MKLNYPFGFAFHDRLTIENKLKEHCKKNIVYLDSLENNHVPEKEYNEVENKGKTIFIIDSVDTLKFIICKLGYVLEGTFILLDSCYNLKKARIFCMDGSYKMGYSQSIGIDVINFAMIANCSGWTKFSTKTLQEEDNNDIKILKSLLSKRKKIKEKVFKKTLQEIIKTAKEEVKSKVSKNVFPVVEKQVGTLIVKCVVNNLPYSELEPLKLIFNNKVIEVKSTSIKKDVKKYSSTSGGIRTIRAFQDMMYYLTNKETALLDNVGDPFTLNLMLEYWNPNPTSRKSVVFIHNKKPLPKKIKSRKKIARWENKKHIISSNVVAIRNKHNNNVKKSKIPPINNVDMIVLNKGLISKKTLMSRMGLDGSKCTLFGGSTKSGKIHLRRGDVISVMNKKERTVHYARVL